MFTQFKPDSHTQCVAVTWRFTGDYEGEYCIAIFSSIQVFNYKSLYWWMNKFVGYQSTDFEKVKQQSVEVAKTNQLPLLWGVGHLVKVREGTSVFAGSQPILPHCGFNSSICNFHPVDEQGNELKSKSETTLKEELGLTSKQIKQLGEPDKIRKNPHYPKGAPMKLYLVYRVKSLFPELERG